MEINNTFTSQNLSYDIQVKNKSDLELSSVNDTKKTLSKEFSLDISRNVSFSSTSISLSLEQIDNRLEALNKIKESMKNFDFQSSISSNKSSIISIEPQKQISSQTIDNVIKSISFGSKIDELEKAKDFLNPNQKFYSQAQKDGFLSRMHEANVNISLLSEEDRKVYINNFNKAMSSDLDKINDFDSAVDSIYLAKKELELSTSLTNKKSIDNQMKTLDKITEKLLEASDNSTSLNKKEALVSEVKELLKKVDNDELESDLSKKLDDVLEKNQEELNSLSKKDIKIKSFDDAKSYLELMQKHDASFEDLSSDEKRTYLENKQKVVDTLKSKDSLDSVAKDSQENPKIETLTQLNTHLNNTLERIQKTEEDEIEELVNPSTIISTVSDAASFLEKAERRDYSISKMSEHDKKMFELNVKEAKEILKTQKENTLQNELNRFVENIDSVIEVLNNAKSNIENIKDIDELKDTSMFSKEKLSSINGSFIISQSSNINTNTVYRLTS